MNTSNTSELETRVLTAIQELTKLNSRPPSIRALATHLQYNSTNTVRTAIGRLEIRGLVAQDPSNGTRSRNLRVVESVGASK